MPAGASSFALPLTPAVGKGPKKHEGLACAFFAPFAILFIPNSCTNPKRKPREHKNRKQQNMSERTRPGQIVRVYVCECRL
jgi:hypothetical protein